ncbi:potassium/proton antiporter [Oceanimonas baumannii]|uniref:Cell volume regulation protein A n=1 Tax=Oceanimonas baumannii TaxID=129578 RepID=A0A235CL27_9GAMM|nr:potassium/proton antiporter [Oceanimonas baumannii]OYD25291.1 K+/H+ antiporter [Oceanimonas baumannii]TDW62413.1 cell volume regulation protein A [Oceanimonas baumannii]
MDNIEHLFLLAGVLLCLSVLATLVSARSGIPILLIFLVIGMLAGESGPGGIRFESYSLAYSVGNLALAIILLDGGMRTRMETFRVGLKPALSLATLGVLITSGITGVLAVYILDLGWLQGLLLGAIVGSTDAAAVFSLLGGRGMQLNQRVGASLEIESGTNDPMAIFLTLTLIALITGEMSGPGEALLFLLSQLGIGALAGLLGGQLLVQLIRRISLASGLYPLLVTGFGLTLFAVTALLQGSGFLAVYLAGLVLGNSRLRNLESILPVFDGLAWLSQIGLFLVLGLLISPTDMWAMALPASLIALAMIFIARPVAVLASLLPFFRFNARELGFISWVGLRGAVPIVLAIFPLMAGIEEGGMLFNVAFFVVLISLLVQGSSLPPMARWLEVEVPPEPAPKRRSMLGIFKEDDFEMFLYQVESQSLDGIVVRQLTFPPHCRVAAVFRGEHLLPASGSTRLAMNDVLCVIGRSTHLKTLNNMFGGDLDVAREKARAFFGDFILDADARMGDVALMYGVDVSAAEMNMTLGEFMLTYSSGHPVVGDHFERYGMVWTVADVDGDRVLKAGLREFEAG